MFGLEIPLKSGKQNGVCKLPFRIGMECSAVVMVHRYALNVDLIIGNPHGTLPDLIQAMLTIAQ